ncbi:MAG: hypothetical protein F4Y24_17125 [Gemmatimonadetes bacterium]|nr:hypothetical protein [Gemmatimonadota bacterium]MYG21133.1 hypothetical protein [Gemmatimonadota bacterium]MYJ38013.1 hypothetical protein [Gemmatimonadota bacterium]
MKTQVALLLLLAAALLACDEPPPIVCLDVPPRNYIVYVGEETIVTPCFTGGTLPLVYAAQSSDTTIARVSGVAGRAVMVAGQGVGAARIVITATDANGKTGEQLIPVGVPNRAPEIAMVSVDVPLWAERRLALADYANDPDRQALMQSVLSETPSTLDARIANDSLYLTGLERGAARLHIAVQDESGVETSATFTGMIGDPVAYVTQGAHSRHGDAPLAARRQGLLRFFLVAPDSADVTAPTVEAFLETRDGEFLREIELSGPSRLPPEIDEGELGQSFNALIEGTDLIPGIKLVIDVGATAGPNVVRRVEMPLEVLNVPKLDLTLIPIAFGEEVISKTFVETVAADPAGSRSPLRGIFEMLPVVDHTVYVRETIDLGPRDDHLTPEFILLALRAVYQIEALDGHYMGIIPDPISVETQGGTVLVAGAAWRGSPIAFAIPSRGTITHELGHSFNLLHAPCGAPGADRRFPYEGGTIGVWGYDFAARLLHEPNTRDVMSYCDPIWISDYHFEKALRYRVLTQQSPPAAPAEEMLMVWGSISADGESMLLPSFYTTGAPTPVSGAGHRLTGRGPVGELFSFEFEPTPIWDTEGSVFTFMVPVTWEGDLETITLWTPDGGSAVLDRDTDNPLSLVIENGRVRRLAAEQVVPEYTPGAIFTRGIPIRR